MDTPDNYDYGRHIEKIQEDWLVREKPYGYERTARIIGKRILEICHVNGCLVASWKDITEYGRSEECGSR